MHWSAIISDEHFILSTVVDPRYKIKLIKKTLQEAQRVSKLIRSSCDEVSVHADRHVSNNDAVADSDANTHSVCENLYAFWDDVQPECTDEFYKYRHGHSILT